MNIDTELMRPFQPSTIPQTGYHAIYQKISQIRDDIKDCLTTADGTTKYKDELDNFNKQLSDLWGQLPPGYLQTDFPAAYKERSYLEMVMKHGETTQGGTGMSVDSIRSQLSSLRWTTLLPDDILVHIFKQGISSEDSHAQLIAYTSVCKHWRNRALLTPFLWGLIEFKDRKPYHLTRLFLERSESAPLNIGINITNKKFDHRFTQLWPPVEDMVERIALFIPQAHRWRSFTCRTDNWGPMQAILDALRNLATPELKTLDLRQNWDVSGVEPISGEPIVILQGGAPQLQQLALCNIARIQWNNVAFYNLAKLELSCFRLDDAPSFQDFRLLLVHSPNLKGLHVTGKGPLQAEGQLLPPVQLLSLEVCEFIGISYKLGGGLQNPYSLDYVLSILSSFVPGPALYSLSLGGLDKDEDILTALPVLRHFAHTKQLQLFLDDITLETATRLLHQMREVRRLAVVAGRDAQSVVIKALIAPSPPCGVLCPSLATFAPAGYLPEFEDISDLVQKRLDHKVGLEKLVFDIREKEYDEMVGLNHLKGKVDICFEGEVDPDEWVGPDPTDSDPVEPVFLSVS